MMSGYAHERFVQQMCSALFLLQKHNIIHRDLKVGWHVGLSLYFCFNFLCHYCKQIYRQINYFFALRTSKLENLMVGAKGKDGKEMIKIGDFGWVSVR